MAKHQSLQPPHPDLLGMTANIVAAYVRSNPLSAKDLPGVIQAVHDSLKELDARGGQPSEAKPPRAAAAAGRRASARKRSSR